MRAVDRHLDQTQDRWIQRLIQIGNLFRHSVGGHRILNQIVGADGEEIRFLGKLIRQHQSAQLSSENISSVQAQTNGAVAQERVHFFREREVRQFLIAADIQRPDDDLLAAHAFQNCLICFKLFVLAREVQFAVHI